jgi:hypothetical protein
MTAQGFIYPSRQVESTYTRRKFHPRSITQPGTLDAKATRDANSSPHFEPWVRTSIVQESIHALAIYTWFVLGGFGLFGFLPL